MLLISANMKVIVDTDPGIDDAVALGMLLSKKDIDILAITCVHGNSTVHQTTTNTLRVLDAFNRKDVPVYKGAETPILGMKWVIVNSMYSFFIDKKHIFDLLSVYLSGHSFFSLLPCYFLFFCMRLDYKY